MIDRKKKISELPEASDLEGLYSIATKSSDNQSYKVDLGLVKTEAGKAEASAQRAEAAADKAEGYLGELDVALRCILVDNTF